MFTNDSSSFSVTSTCVGSTTAVRGGWHAALPIAALLLLLFPAAASADSVSLTGSFIFDPQNPDANQVFLYAFTLGAPGKLTIQTFGYGGGTMADGTVVPAGGFDPILSLFSGTGDLATFIALGDDIDYFAGDWDALIELPSAAAGDYTVALTMFANYPFAWNYGSGTLGDGFIGLGNWDLSRTPNWAMDIVAEEGTVTPVPEPGTLALTVTGILLGILTVRKRLQK